MNSILAVTQGAMPDSGGWPGSDDDPAAVLVENLGWREALVIAFAGMAALASEGDAEGIAL